MPKPFVKYPRSLYRYGLEIVVRTEPEEQEAWDNGFIFWADDNARVANRQQPIEPAEPVVEKPTQAMPPPSITITPKRRK